MLWADILISNRTELSDILSKFSDDLKMVTNLLDSNDRKGLEKWLKEIAIAKEKQK